MEEGEVAERKRRRDEEPADEHFDEELFDEDAADDVAEVDDDEDEKVSAGRSGRGGGLATKERARADRPVKKDRDDRVGIFGRIARFVREVVAELRKVIWPTRKELLTYTAVVVVFVAVMLSIVALLDVGFAWLVLRIFGDPNAPAVTE